MARATPGAPGGQGGSRLGAWGKASRPVLTAPHRAPPGDKAGRGLRGLQCGSGVTLRASRMCGDPGEGHQGTIVICSPWLVRGRSFGVWDSPVPSSYPRGTRFLLSFPSLESRVSNPELYLPRLTLPTTGSKSLNFRDPSHIPKANSLSSVHSIFINYLSFVVCFKQTSYFNCLFFLCRVAGGSLLNIYICLSFA